MRDFSRNPSVGATAYPRAGELVDEAAAPQIHDFSRAKPRCGLSTVNSYEKVKKADPGPARHMLEGGLSVAATCGRIAVNAKRERVRKLALHDIRGRPRDAVSRKRAPPPLPLQAVVSALLKRILGSTPVFKEPGGDRDGSLAVVAFSYQGYRMALVASTRPPLARVLSPKQLSVLRWLGRGLGSKGIGRELKIAETTVNDHIREAKRRLGLHTRAQLTRHIAIDEILEGISLILRVPRSEDPQI